MMKFPGFLILGRRLKRWDRRLTISRRQQFVLIVTSLVAGLVLTQIASLEWRYPLVFFLAVMAYFLSALGLREDLHGVEWLTLLILPTMFTAAVALFYFLLPVRWLTRVPVAALYGVGMYALLLTENIYNVAASRTIGLLRAAHSVGFLITLITNFLLVQTAISFRFYPPVAALSVGLIGYLLALQSFWSIELNRQISQSALRLSLVISVVLGELTLILSFWPLKPTMFALLLTTCLYCLGGLSQQFLEDKLYKKSVNEFLLVGLIVFGFVLWTTHWRGNF